MKVRITKSERLKEIFVCHKYYIYRKTQFSFIIYSETYSKILHQAFPTVLYLIHYKTGSVEGNSICFIAELVKSIYFSVK